MITAVNPEGMRKAVDWVKQLTREVKVGEIFTGPVTRIMDFGAFVEILPKQEGLVHISEMAPYRVASVHDICNVGDMVTVKVYEIDSMGRINLSIKRAAADYVEQPGDERSLRDRKTGGGGRGPDRPRFGGGGGRRDIGGGGRGPRRDAPQQNGPAAAPRPPITEDPFDVSI